MAVHCTALLGVGLNLQRPLNEKRNKTVDRFSCLNIKINQTRSELFHNRTSRNMKMLTEIILKIGKYRIEQETIRKKKEIIYCLYCIPSFNSLWYYVYRHVYRHVKMTEKQAMSESD